MQGLDSKLDTDYHSVKNRQGAQFVSTTKLEKDVMASWLFVQGDWMVPQARTEVPPGPGLGYPLARTGYVTAVMPLTVSRKRTFLLTSIFKLCAGGWGGGGAVKKR